MGKDHSEEEDIELGNRHRDVHHEEYRGASFGERIITFFVLLIVILTFPLSIWFCIKVVKTYERAVIFRLGRVLGGSKGPGMFFIYPWIDTMRLIDLRTVTYNVPKQDILTKDSVTLNVDAVVFYKIWGPVEAVVNVENASFATQLLAQTSLRNVLGTKNLAELLSHREEISESLRDIMDDATEPWGVSIQRVELRDVVLPKELQRAMAAVAEAARDAEAKVISAEGEKQASTALKEAADVMSSGPGALQLRYLQTLVHIAAEKNSTILFPLPMELLGGMKKEQTQINQFIDSVSGLLPQVKGEQ